ncbi:MAG: hypothetical protein AB8G86_30425 [Saprospiraceae bacterium]
MREITIIYITVLLLLIGCKSPNLIKYELRKVRDISLNIPNYIDINSFSHTSDIQILNKDTFLTFIDQVDEKIYTYKFGEKNLESTKFYRYGPNQLKSEPYLVKVLSNEEILIICQREVVFSNRNKEVNVSKEISLKDESTDLTGGDSYWFRQYIDKEYAYFFKFDFSKGRYDNKLIRFTLNSGEQEEINIPLHYTEIMNEDKSKGGIKTSILLPQVSFSEGKIIFSSWYSNKVFIGKNELILPYLNNHYEFIKNSDSGDEIFNLDTEEGSNATLIFDSFENILIVDKIKTNKETGLIKNELCFFDIEGNLLNCVDSKGLLKFHSAGYLYFLNILEAEDKATFSIYRISDVSSH